MPARSPRPASSAPSPGAAPLEAAFDTHDHRACVADALARAEALCARQKLNFTPVRRRVLEILLDEHRAMGAYEVLDHLAAEGRTAQPPVAYRALDFLVRHGLAHKVERLNAFVACTHPQAGAVAPVLLICRDCGAVAETHWRPESGRLGALARRAGFVVEAVVTELTGLCPACAAAAS